MKEKVILENEMETLLIPLYGRAKMTERGLLNDVFACHTVEKIDYDFDKLAIPEKLLIFMSIRSLIFDDYARQFLRDNPRATVISLGSGLDARYARVEGYKRWIDLDFPQVANLRERLLPRTDNNIIIPSSVTDRSWVAGLEADENNTLIIAEGLLMYIHEREVQELFSRITAKFPKSTFIFDAYSTATLKKIKWQSSFRKTGASVHWAIDTPDEVSKLCPRMACLESIYLTDKRYTGRLSRLYRFLFAFAGKFEAARQAHRVFVFEAKQA